MKTKFIILGAGLMVAAIVLPGIWYALSLLTGGMLNLLTCCMGDVCCWSVSGLSCLAGIVLVILGLVLATEVVAANP